jgi:hypothetical protein
MKGAIIATMEASRPTQAERLVTLVGPEHIQALIAISPTPNARPVVLDMLNRMQDRTTVTQHVGQARSRQEAPLHAHLATLDMLNQVEDRTTVTQHVELASIL